MVGSAAAGVTGTSDVDGCLILDDYLELDNTALLPTVEIGLLPTVAPVTGGTLNVLAGANIETWNIEVIDDDHIGKLIGPGSVPLTDPLSVNAVPLGTVAGVEIGDGVPSVDCDGTDVPITYAQTVQGADLTSGRFTISLTYTLADTTT